MTRHDPDPDLELDSVAAVLESIDYRPNGGKPVPLTARRNSDNTIDVMSLVWERNSRTPDSPELIGRVSTTRFGGDPHSRDEILDAAVEHVLNGAMHAGLGRISNIPDV